VVAAEHLKSEGWALVSTGVAPEVLEELRETIFTDGAAGRRCLLDEPLVRNVARGLKAELIAAGILSRSAVAIQAIAFDKTPDTNWKVAWHQDVMFPFGKAATREGYAIPTKKSGVDFARPPLAVLEDMLAVRLHCDDCDETNGPLRVVPGSHRLGLIPSDECGTRATSSVPCLAQKGEALLMKPLLLHASSQATEPKHRRVLHVVYHSGARMEETWHRAI
jgi:ectoine hydroxylase-related dioxygenase (phytanoyl-CoA dioxygenase family)